MEIKRKRVWRMNNLDTQFLYSGSHTSEVGQDRGDTAVCPRGLHQRPLRCTAPDRELLYLDVQACLR
jgi:hypothetical protein